MQRDRITPKPAPFWSVGKLSSMKRVPGGPKGPGHQCVVGFCLVLVLFLYQCEYQYSRKNMPKYYFENSLASRIP